MISSIQTLNHENRFMISMISYNESLARDHDLYKLRIHHVTNYALSCRSFYLNSSRVLTLDLLQDFLFSEIIISMYLNQVFKLSSSVAKRRCLSKKLHFNDSSVMHLCNHCFNRFVKCCVDTDFDRCVECMHLDRKCDLIVSETE